MAVIESTSISFVDLGRQHRRISADLRAAFDRVVDNGSFTLGSEVEAFETEFAAFVGCAQAVGVGSGTDALHFVLRACGVGEGDEVITAVNTFAATAEAIVMAGARPVFVDIDPATYLMDLDAVEHAITPATKAIIPVHLYGQCVDMRRVIEIARRHGLKVIEDACQAHGATRDGLSAGAAGDAGCFSFYPSKNLGALGDGGIVTTNDPAIADRVRSLRSHGEDANRLHVEVGYCSRLHGLQAGLLRAKLPHLADWNALRIQAARTYLRELAGACVDLPAALPDAHHVYHLFVVRVRDRERVRAELGTRGVQTAIHYSVPLHLEPAFAGLGYARGDFPNAEDAVREIVSLPMFPYLTDDEVRYVARCVAEVCHA
jgi:dTDP-4-amino-4,6-dideoxygalactose transaminase